ncbi:MAG: hypothetical protein KIS86_17090 [Devosia sp.]|nr:hypothetical protein [Devosia sp.]
MKALFDIIEDQPLALVPFGAVLALIFGVRHLGLWQGQMAAQKPASGAQVAAVIVDPTALTAAAGEVAGLTVAVTAATVAAGAHTAATDRLADEVKEGTREMRELRIELRAMTDKMRDRG